MSDNDRPTGTDIVPAQDQVDKDAGTFWVLVTSTLLAAASLYLSWRRTPRHPPEK
jgi:hypothetical protein